MLDALASTEGTPTKIMAGRVTNDPPPAAAFIAPATSPAARRMRRFVMKNTVVKPPRFCQTSIAESRGSPRSTPGKINVPAAARFILIAHFLV